MRDASLLLRRLEVRVAAVLVRGDVDDIDDLGHRLSDRERDPLAERHGRESTTLATAGESEVGDSLVDGDEVRPTAMKGDLRVDLLFENGDHRAGERARHVALGNRGRGGRDGRRVRVQHDKSLFAESERRAPHLVDAVTTDDDGELVVAAQNITRRGVGERLEPHLVDVGAVCRPGHLDEERQAFRVLLGRAGLEDRGPSGVGDGEHRVGARSVERLVGHAAMVGATPELTSAPRWRAATHRHDGGMARVLLVLPSSTYRATDFLVAAGRLGVDVVTGSDAPQAMAGTTPDRFLVLPLDDPAAAADAVATRHSVTPFDAVLAVDDAGALVATAAAERLGLAKNPFAAVAATRDKSVMRQFLHNAGVRQPRFEIVGAGAGESAAVAAAGAHLGYPVVVKPCSLSASRGVIRADDDGGARAAAVAARHISCDAGRPAEEPLLVEEFVAGDEVAVEGLLSAGRLDVLAVFDKPDPLEGPYFEETIYVTPSRHPEYLQEALHATVASACAALSLVDGPVHAEARLSPRGTHPEAEVVVIEVAARTIGGRCSRALHFSSGRSLEEIVLAHALGLDYEVANARLRGASGVMMLPIPASGRFAGIDGSQAALAVPGVWGIEVTVPVGGTLTAWPAGDRYLGFLFARAALPEQVEAALRSGFAALAVRVDAEVASGASG